MRPREEKEGPEALFTLDTDAIANAHEGVERVATALKGLRPDIALNALITSMQGGAVDSLGNIFNQLAHTGVAGSVENATALSKILKNAHDNYTNADKASGA